MNTVGVVTVTFRGGDAVIQTLDALECAREHLGTGAALRAVLVDNASGDGTIERARDRAPWADVIALPRNVGFAAACNVGLAHASDADIIVLLNPDVAVRSDFLARLVALEWPVDVAALGPAILDPQGRVEQSARGFPQARTALLGRTSLVARIRPTSRLLQRDLLAAPHLGTRVVDWVSGACMIVPAGRFRTVGLFDEKYFMYWEDADWCRRAHDMGYRVVYEPRLVVTHRQGSSSEHRPIATTAAFHLSAFRYWRKNVAKSPASTIAAAVALSMRCVLKLILLAAHGALTRLHATQNAV